MGLSEYFSSQFIRAAYSIYDRLQPEGHLRHLAIMDRIQYVSREQLMNLQLAKLRKLLKIALLKSPYWHDQFAGAGLSLTDIEKIDSLNGIPLLTRDSIIVNRDRIVVSDIAQESLHTNMTGGTTASPMTYYLDDHKIAIREGATLRHNLWAGYRIGDRLAIIWSSVLEESIDPTLRRRIRELFWGKFIRLGTNRIDEKALIAFSQKWHQFRPNVLLAYAGALSFIVERLKEMNIELESPQTIITSAEVLTSDARQRIQDFFHVPIFNRYGCREVSIIASECQYHNGLHINADNLYIEFVDELRLKDGRRIYRLLVTDLENLVFPIIRYDIGDFAEMHVDSEVCSCGRTLPRLRNVIGRTMDILHLPGDYCICCHDLPITAFRDVNGIAQAQIIQMKLDQMLVRIVRNQYFSSESFERLQVQFQEMVGNNVDVSFEFPDKIERERSGKYRLVISKVGSP